jgi:multiple antibiotic resistance protein
MFAVIAPLGALPTMLAWSKGALGQDRGPDPRIAVLSPAAALALLAAASLVDNPLLDWLDISPESFQGAAGAAMGILAARLILAGDSMPAPERTPAYAWLVPFAVPMLAGPSSIIAAISYAARFGEVEAIAASAIVLAFTGALFALLPRLDRLPLIVAQAAARLSGGLLLVVAIELVIDGVHSV